MKSLDELASISVSHILRLYGFKSTECPIEPNHELSVVSDAYVVCHSCGIEWDSFGLQLDLARMDTHSELSSSEDIKCMTIESSPAVEPAPEETETHHTDITVDFVAWVRANRQHILRTPLYDGDHANAIGFVTLKGNLCLLPCVTHNLTLSQVRLLEEEWQRTNMLYPPKTGRGIKRTERIPMELRKTHGCSTTMKVYTFHRRETVRILEVSLNDTRLTWQTA